MTEQEQAVIDRLGQFIDEAVANGRPLEPAVRVLHAIDSLELAPEECTTDVLRALWAIADEFRVGQKPKRWVGASGAWVAVVTHVNIHYEKRARARARARHERHEKLMGRR